MIFRESILDKKTLPGVSANGYVVKILPRIFKVWQTLDSKVAGSNPVQNLETEQGTESNWSTEKLVYYRRQLAVKSSNGVQNYSCLMDCIKRTSGKSINQ